MRPYKPEDWYWIVGGDGTRLWSSAQHAYVPAAEIPDGYGYSRIETEEALSHVLRNAGIAGPVVTAEDVKEEARRRILAAVPDWKQANMTARGVELVRKLGLGQQLTTDEDAEVIALQAAWDWIKAVRTASDVIEQTMPLPVDYADDQRWPASL